MTQDIEAKVAAVRRRMRAQRALERATLAGVAALALGCVLLFVARLGWLGQWQAWVLGWAAAAVPLAAAAVSAARGVTRFEAARALDVTNGLGDRMASALAFGARPGEADASGGRAAFVAALLRDAARAAARADPGRAAPWRLPRDLRALALGAAALAVTGALRFPVPAPAAPPPAPPRFYLAVAELDLAAAEKAAARAAAAAEKTKDERLRAAARALGALWTDVRAENVTPAEAFARLAAVNDAVDRAASGAKVDVLRGKLRALAKAMLKDPSLDELGRALDVEDFAKARAELDKLAAALRDRALDAGAMRSLARTVAAAAAALAAAPGVDAEEDAAKAEALARDVAALEAKKDRTADEERTLKRKKDELAALAAARDEAAADKKMVERLERDLDALGDMLKKDDAKGAGDKAQEIEDEMAGMEEKLGHADATDKLRKALAEGKLTIASGKLRQKGTGKGGPGEGGDGEESGGEGVAGEGDGEGEGDGVALKMRRFMVKTGRVAAPVEAGAAAGTKPGDAKGDAGDGKAGKGDTPAAPGTDGDPRAMDDTARKGHGAAGASHDGRSGAATDLSGAGYKDIDVPGKRGPGPLRSKVMMGAATEGFSVRGYKPMYEAAAAATEDALEEDRVPLGYKRYVRRYMDLIRPE